MNNLGCAFMAITGLVAALTVCLSVVLFLI